MTKRNRLSLDPGRVLALLCLVAPPVSLASALALAPLVAVAALALLPGLTRRRPTVGWATCAILLAFLAWCAVTLGWSLEPSLGARSLAMLVGVVAGGLVLCQAAAALPPERVAQAIQALSLGLGLALSLLLVTSLATRLLTNLDAERFYWLYRLTVRFDRSTTVIALLLWPTLLGLRQTGRAKMAWSLFVFALLALLPTYDLAAKLALVAGGLIYALVRTTPRGVTAVLAALLVAAHLAAPLAAAALPSPETAGQWRTLPLSAHHRIVIWSFVEQRIEAHPWRGWGFESARSMPGGKEDYQFVRPQGGVTAEPYLPLHPHDASLQIWLELGIVGAILWAALIGLAGRAVAGIADPSARAAAAATLIVAFLVDSVSYGAWQAWWLSTLWVALSLLMALSRREPA